MSRQKSSAFPIEVLRHHTAVLGKTGSGKTSTEKLIIEQVVADGARVCVLDTLKSDWWGITSSASGKSAGLPFQILGGPRGHVKLHSSAGKVIGQLVGNGKLPLSIVDMADFEPGGIQRFFVDFAQSLWKNLRGVVYLVIEEAHEIAPKERAGFGAENMAIHWAKKLATGSRTRGIKLIVATQRVQALHNAVLGSCETLVAHRLTMDADQEPVLKWLKGANKAKALEVGNTLASLPTGTGWICSGEAQIFEKVAFPKFRTFDNTATPEIGAAEIEVKTAQIDHAALRDLIGEEVQKAEADDPKALRKRIAELEAAERKTTVTKPPAVDPDVIKKAEDRGFEKGVKATQRAAERALKKNATEFLGELQTRIGPLTTFVSEQRSRFLKELSFERPQNEIEKSGLPAKPVAAAAPKPATPRVVKVSSSEQGGGSGPLDQRIIDALARLAAIRVAPASRSIVGAMVGYSNFKSGTFATAVGRTIANGLVQAPRPRYVELTAEGASKANAPSTMLTTEDIQRAVTDILGTPADKILAKLIEVYPNAITRAELGAAANYSNYKSGTFATATAKIIEMGFGMVPSKGLVIATEILFP